MASETGAGATLQIAHVLTIDIVEYSKLLITDQSAIIGELGRIVRETARFRQAEAAEKLLRIPTGDGMMLIFFDDPQAPIECAMEIAGAIRGQAQMRLRMGIHSGPVHHVTDVNDRSNLAGAGIDMAQRVMDQGDAGHILLSKRVAEDLTPFPRWNPHLHDLGECEVKHGKKISLVNFYTERIGNPETPQRCQLAGSRAVASPLAPRRWIWPAAAVLVLGLILVLGLLLISRRSIAPAHVSTAPPERVVTEKSIAVLPFENLSGDPGNAYFADGIQEEVLTRLARIGDLKVISRTSTERYKSAPIDLPQIAQQLGVAHILEGSVQKAADQVRVNVQLIKAHDDSHLWAERYDRKLTDVFAVESEIASKIAEVLQAKLTGAEQRAIAVRPTENPEAHELYLRGRFFWNKWLGPDFDKSREYYEKALQLDPGYALAYAGLADYYGFAFANGLIAPEEKWARLEEENAKKALALEPSLGEAYNSLAAEKLYYERDWPAAEQYFHKGLELSPNFSEMRHHYSLCLILFGRKDEAFAQMKQALELDPLSPRFRFNAGRLHFFARDYEGAIASYRRGLELDPGFSLGHEFLGYAYEANGMQKEAIAEWKKALLLRGAQSDAALLDASDFAAARQALARKQLEELKAKSAGGEYVAAALYAITSLRAGEKEEAFAWLAKAAAERNRLALEIKVNPLYDPLRDDPRFQQIVAQIMPAQSSGR